VNDANNVTKKNQTGNPFQPRSGERLVASVGEHPKRTIERKERNSNCPPQERSTPGSKPTFKGESAKKKSKKATDLPGCEREKKGREGLLGERLSFGKARYGGHTEKKEGPEGEM